MKHANTFQERGVSLIEALVALAVMAIGMLGLVGLQTSLRSTSDVAKQRSMAVRLAQSEIEAARAFVFLESASGTPAYGELAAGTTTTTAPANPGDSATYTIEKVITNLALPRRGKAMVVTVSWTDRSSEFQSVRLATTVAGIAPELAATLTVPGDGDVLQQPLGRKRGLPPLAKDLGGGKSGFIPPTTPTVAWIFNNVTGLVTVCTTVAASTSDLIYVEGGSSNNVDCTGSTSAILLSGFVRYATGTTQPTSVDAAQPPSPPLSPTPNLSVVYTNAPGGTVTCATADSSSGSHYTAYYCAIPVAITSDAQPTWSGRVSFSGLPWANTGNSASQYRVCRYYATSPYALVTDPLMNQNYLVIAGGSGTGDGFTCPTPTVLHQQAP